MAEEPISLSNNPYAKALEGLKLDDPVQAFFDFCKERESIRLKREKGEPSPWTDDKVRGGNCEKISENQNRRCRENVKQTSSFVATLLDDQVFQQGRFLNVFREDDRGTKALFNFVRPIVEKGDGVKLVQALFFGRWCNRDHTLNELDSGMLDQDPKALKNFLTTKLDFPPWCNETAYPVEIVTWKGVKYSRLDAATILFKRICGWLCEVIESSGRDVVKATQTIANELGMKNDFPVFMAVMDVAWFRPDLINPSSVVPTGIGAVAYLDILQKHLGVQSHEEAAMCMIKKQAEYWPEAKRPFEPIDIEYLSCECRKYYSYVNGTKSYEGKNVFKPGKSPMLPFDIPQTTDSTKCVKESEIIVITGSPNSDRAAVVREMGKSGHNVTPDEHESMEDIYDQEMDSLAWQMKVLKHEFSMFEQLFNSPKRVIVNTSFIDSVVLAARAGIEMSPNVKEWIKSRRYYKVFYMPDSELNGSSKDSDLSKKAASQIDQQTREAYKHYGYTLIEVPRWMNLKHRIKFVEEHI